MAVANRRPSSGARNRIALNVGFSREFCMSDYLRCKAFVGDNVLKRILQLFMGFMVKRSPNQQLLSYFMEKRGVNALPGSEFARLPSQGNVDFKKFLAFERGTEFDVNQAILLSVNVNISAWWVSLIQRPFYEFDPPLNS